MVQKFPKLDPRAQTEAYQKVVNWFFAYPGIEMSLNDLSIKLKISKSTANRVINLLVEEGFLKKQVIGNIWRISCVASHHYNFTRKIGHNLIMIYESGIIEEVHKLIPNSKAIILFGSYRKGDDNEASDIDIAAEVIDDEDIRIVEIGTISKLGYRKDVRVNLHIFSRKKVNLNLFANIANGIVLEGFLEVRP